MTHATGCCSVVELREYTMQPGARDTLIDLFDREFIETQEEVGIHVIGQFRDVDRPDRYVWLRGFPDMEARRASLEAFYTGPTWAAHRDAANATLIDSDNVLLLKPAHAGAGFAHAPAHRSVSAAAPAGAYEITVTPRAIATATDAYPHGGVLAAEYVTEPAENSYPRLPIREGEDVLVRVCRFDSIDEIKSTARVDAVSMRLTPTSTSQVR